MDSQLLRSLAVHSVQINRLLLAWRAENLLSCRLEGFAKEFQGPTVSCSVPDREPHPAERSKSAVPSPQHCPVLLAPCWQSWQAACLWYIGLILSHHGALQWCSMTIAGVTATTQQQWHACRCFSAHLLGSYGSTLQW